MIQIRPYNAETDLDFLVELYNCIFPEPINAELVREIDGRRAQTHEVRRMMALDESGRPVGGAEVGRAKWSAPGRYFAGVIVPPANRGKGIGQALWADMETYLRENGCTRCDVEVRDNDPASRAFGEHRGFVVDRHVFESTLDVAAFDETPFADAIGRAEASGIRFLSLADAGADDPAVRRKLYEVFRDTAVDIPGRADRTFPPFEHWEKDNLAASWYRPDLIFIAADGDNWVGVTVMNYHEDIGLLGQNLTGVRAEYRGRGIALALKLLGLRAARRYKADRVRTNNDSLNAPMLAVNRKLGFQPQPGMYLLIRRF